MVDMFAQMRALFKGSPYSRKATTTSFLRQAKFLEPFEDNAPRAYVKERYYPTFQDLTLPELRGYLTWRTRVRQGAVEKTSLTYAYLYLYELLHYVGSASPEEGLDKLLAFVEAYSALDSAISRNAKQWVVDYVVYYGLPIDERLRPYFHLDFDDAFYVVQHCEEATDEELFGAIRTLSSYRAEKSKAAKAHPDVLQAAVCSTYRRMNSRYAKRYNRPYTYKLFGPPTFSRYYPFRNAIFCEQRRPDEVTLNPSPVQTYAYRKGVWSLRREYSTTTRSKDLGVLVRTADRLLREAYGITPALKPGAAEPVTIVKYLSEAIDQAKEAERPVVEFDLRKVRGIRETSEAVSRRIMTSEERFDEEAKEAKAKEPVAKVLEAKASEAKVPVAKASSSATT